MASRIEVTGLGFQMLSIFLLLSNKGRLEKRDFFQFDYGSLHVTSRVFIQLTVQLNMQLEEVMRRKLKSLRDTN